MIKPRNIQIYIAWSAIDMFMGQHHLTFEELDEAVDIYKKNDIVLKPEYKSEEIRSGTPVEKICEVNK